MPMTNTKPNVDPKGYYNMTEAANALGVNRHTVRRYESDGCIRFQKRRAGRSKVTTGAQIIRCWERMY